jgi:cytochrome b pre-mRNA-processing protein 3
MIFKTKEHNSDLYTTFLFLSRNLNFYNKINLKDTFETRIYLMFMHFSVILIIYKNRKINFNQDLYDNFFFNIESNLRELGFGDVAVNSKMKNLNKVFYDILLKFNIGKEKFKTNEKLVFKYFNELNNIKYKLFEQYFHNFYHFCFEKDHIIMIKEALDFKD